MTAQKMIRFTEWFIWVVGLIVIGVDIYLATNGYYGDTISEVTQAYSWRWQTIPLAYGTLTGHLFWSHFGPVKHRGLRNMVLAIAGVVSLMIDAVDLYDVMPIIPVLVGIPLGRYAWPLSTDRESSIFRWNR